MAKTFELQNKDKLEAVNKKYGLTTHYDRTTTVKVEQGFTAKYDTTDKLNTYKKNSNISGKQNENSASQDNSTSKYEAYKTHKEAINFLKRHGVTDGYTIMTEHEWARRPHKSGTYADYLKNEIQKRLGDYLKETSNGAWKTSVSKDVTETFMLSPEQREARKKELQAEIYRLSTNRTKSDNTLETLRQLQKELDAFDSPELTNEQYRKKTTLSVNHNGQTKVFGTISYPAYKALIDGKIDEYTPINAEEKTAIESYTSWAKAEAKKARNPENFWQGLVHSVGYTGEKVGAGAVDAIADAGDYVLAGGGAVVGGLAWGLDKVFPGAGFDKQADDVWDWSKGRLKAETLGDVWSNSAESRYRVPDWLRNNIGPAATNFGAMVPAMVAEVATGSAAPTMDTLLARSSSASAKTYSVGQIAKDFASRLAKPKVSDKVFFTTAAGGYAKEGYEKSGNLGSSLVYGAYGGLLEVATEKINGGYGGTGIGADDAFELGQSTLGRRYLASSGTGTKLMSNKYLSKLDDVLVEGVEEAISAEINPLLQRLTVDPNAKLATVGDLSKSAWDGIVLSAFSNAVTTPVQKTVNWAGNRHEIVATLNAQADEINKSISNDADKIAHVHVVSSNSAIQAVADEIARKEAIIKLNKVTNATNEMFKSEGDKFQPLEMNSTEAEVLERQQQVGELHALYSATVTDDVISKNPELAKGSSLNVTTTNLDAMSAENEALSVEDVKRATGFGENGAMLVTELANAEGSTFSQAKRAVETAYLAGYSNDATVKAKLKPGVEQSAYEAGVADRTADNGISTAKAKEATTYNTGFTENEHSKKLTDAERTMFSYLAEDLKMDIAVMDKVIANYVTMAEANAQHTDGKMRISSTSELPMIAVGIHESGHRMAQFDTDAWNTLKYALYETAEQLGKRSSSGYKRNYAFDSVKSEHDSAGITMGTGDYIEEIAVRQLETIFASPEAFNRWRAKLELNPKAKSAWKKFVEWFKKVIRDIKMSWANRKLTKEQRANAKKAIAEAERILKLFESAYVSSISAAEARANEAAFEAGKANVPRENVTLATKAQEDAYNKGRLEHIKNLKNKPVTKEKVEARESITETKKSEQGNKTNFSLKGTRADGIEVYETSKEVMQMPITERIKLYIRLMNNEYVGRTARFVRNGHTYYAEFDRDNLGKAMYGDKRSSESGYKALTRLGAEGDIFDLVENSSYSHSKVDKKGHKNTDYFDYYIKTVQIDNKVYDLLADVKKKYGKDGGYVYTVILKDNKKIKAAPTKASQNNALQVVGTTLNDTDNVPQNPKSVKSDFSLKNTEVEKNKPSTKYSLKLATEGKHKEKIANVYAQVVDENGNILKDADGNPMVAVDLKTLIQRYDKLLDIWQRVSKSLDSDFLNNWNNTVGKDRAFTVFKEQAGYKYNIELSSKCKKAIPLFEAIDEIVKTEAAKELKSGKIGKVEKEILYDILKTKGFEIPCAICYVEQARQREGEIIKGFLDGNKVQKKNGTYETYKIGWNEALHEIENRMKAKGVDFKFPKLSRDAATDAYTPADLTMDRATQTAFYEVLKDVTNEEIKRYNSQPSRKGKKSIPLIKNAIPEGVNSVLKGSLPLNLRMFKTMFNEPTSRFIIDSDLLYSSMTTKNLASFHNGLYSVFNSQGGSGGYKTKQGTVAYWGDLLGKKWNPKKLRGEGAIRNQSNSDLMMYTLLDQVQMYVDLTAKGYYLHAYTKVPAELKLFGLSGAKINASGIPKVVVYRNDDRSVDVAKTQMNAGLDENGNPIYDFIEGINIDEAFMLVEDKEYSKSLCVVCIGYSDKHIEKLLDDDRIGMIIGFHDKTDNPDKRYYGARYAHNYNGVNEAAKKKADGTYETKHINFNQFIEKAEKKLKKKSSVEFGGKTYEYNDIPRLAADLYLEYCNEKGLSPAYSRCGIDFSEHPNYYKLLTDYGLYDSEGNYAPMQKVNFNMPDKVPYLDNGKVAYMDTEAYIQKELASELRVMDSISNALSDKSEGGIIPEFVRKANESYDADSEQRTSFSLKKSNTTSTQDTKELLETIEHLKHEFEVTKFAKADPKKLEKMTREILKDYDSKADLDETFKAVDELYKYMANGEDGHPAVWNDVYDRAYNIARDIVENAVVLDDEMYQEYKSLRDYLRKTPMRFIPIFDSVPTSYETFNDFRKHNMGRLKFTNDGMSIDSVYQELSSLYPEFFDAEEQTDSADMLERIEEVLDEIQPTEVNPYDSQMGQVASYLANDLTSRFFDIPQAKPTFADKAEQKVVKEKIKGSKKLEKARQQRDEKIKKVIKKQRENTKKQLDKVRQQRDAKVAKEKAKRDELREKISENQKTKELRAKISRHVAELSKTLRKATDKKHIPSELENAVTALLYNINLESNYTYDAESDSYKKNLKGLPTNKTQAFLSLKEVYAQIAKNNDYNLSLAPELIGASEEGIGNLFDEVMKLSEKKIADMTSVELTTIYDAMRIIEHSIAVANKAFAVQKWATFNEMGKAFDDSTKTRRPIHPKMKTQLILDIKTPLTFFSELGEAGVELYNTLRAAQDQEQIMTDELAELMSNIVSLEQVNKANKKVHEFTTAEGKKLKLSQAHIMNIYLLYNREQGKKHLLFDPESGYTGRGIHQPEVKRIRRDSEPTRLTKSDLDNILSKLDKEYKDIADNLQKATLKLAEWGNKACKEVFGYEKFKDADYWTVMSASESIHQDTDKKVDKPRSIKNIGSGKPTNEFANNAVNIDGVFDVFAKHASEMISYSAWLAPMEDMSRLYNYSFRDESGNITGRTFRSMLEKYAGSGGSKYYSQLMDDIQNGIGKTPDTTFEKWYTTLYGAAAKAAVSFKATVVVQQPMAIVRAITVMNPVYITEALTKGAINVAISPIKKVKNLVKKPEKVGGWYGGWQRALKYAPIASRKAAGGYEMGANAISLASLIYQPDTKWGKTKDFVKESPLWAAGKADEITWGVLWNACELEVRKDKSLEKGSEEFYKAVASRFTDVINQTQVVDGVLQRSQAMRSGSGWVRPLTSFKGEPTMALNAVIRAYENLRYETDPKRRGHAKRRLSRAAFVFIASSIVTAFARSLAVGITGEEDEEYWKKVWKSFSGIQGNEKTWFDYLKNIGLKSDVVNNMNPASLIPFMNEVMSLMQGYDVERLDVSSISSFVTAGKQFIESLDEEGKYTVGYSLRKMILKGVEFTGWAPNNLVRDIEGAIRTIRNEKGDLKGVYEMEKWKTKPTANTAKYVDFLYDAYNTDRETYEYIYNDLIKEGVDEEKIKNGMESRMKNAEGVKEATDLSKRYMNPETEKIYDNGIKRVQSNEVWRKSTADQKKKAEAVLYEYLTSEAKDKVEKREEAKKYGVDETELVLWELASEMADDAGNKDDYINAKEKKAALEMIDLGNSEIAYFYNTKTGDKAYENGIDMYNFAMFMGDIADAKGKTKQKQITESANQFAETQKEWLFFMGTQYDKYKKRSDYIGYFGKEEKKE